MVQKRLQLAQEADSFSRGLRLAVIDRLGTALALARCAGALGREEGLADSHLLQALQHCLLALRDAQRYPPGTGVQQQLVQAIKVRVLFPCILSHFACMNLHALMQPPSWRLLHSTNFHRSAKIIYAIVNLSLMIDVDKTVPIVLVLSFFQYPYQPSRWSLLQDFSPCCLLSTTHSAASLSSQVRVLI